MSYLLKALQKAEQERQQHQEPNQTSQIVKVESNLPKSLLLIIFILVAVTIWQLLSSKHQVVEDHDFQSKGNHSNNTSDNMPVVKGSSEQNQPKTEKATSVSHKQSHIGDDSVEVKDLSDLTATELSRIPSLELASHIYSSAPEFRSVVINGQTYREGMLIMAGIQLVEITQIGINISVNGLLVSLPKGISWIASQNVK